MLLSAGIGAAGNIFGQAKSAKANQKYDSYLKGMNSRLDNWYNKEYNTNYLDTEEAKAVIRQLLEQAKQANEDMASKSAVTGDSAEKQVAQKDKLNKNMAGAMTRMAGMGTQRKENVQNQYMNRLGQLDQLKLQNLNQKSQNWNQFGQNASGVAQNMMLSGTLGGNAGGLFGGGQYPAWLTKIMARLNTGKNLDFLSGPFQEESPMENWMTNFFPAIEQ